MKAIPNKPIRLLMSIFVGALSFQLWSSYILAAESNLKFDGKTITLIDLGLELKTYGWDLVADQEELDNLSDEAVAKTDASVPEAIAMSLIKLSFMLFEKQDKMIGGFRTNVNLVIDHSVKRGTTLYDYTDNARKGMGTLLKNFESQAMRSEMVNGIQFYVLESEHDTLADATKNIYICDASN